MAIARVLAVKRFRKQLIRLKHPDVICWTERQLKNALFRNSNQWLELLRWLLGELDDEIKECLTNCNEEERMSRVKESILVLGLCPTDKIDRCVKGRVNFREREELVTQLTELVKMKKAIDSGGAPCVVESPGINMTDVKEAQSAAGVTHCEDLDRASKPNEKTEILTGRELFDLLVAKNPEYQRLMLFASDEAKNMRVDLEGVLSDDEEGNLSMPRVEEMSLNSDESDSSVDVTGDYPCVIPEPDNVENIQLPGMPKTVDRNQSVPVSELDDKPNTIDLEMERQIPSPLTTVAKDVYGEGSPNACAHSESAPYVSNDEAITCDSGESKNVDNRSGTEPKPLTYLDVQDSQ